jgi:thiaminase
MLQLIEENVLKVRQTCEAVAKLQEEMAAIRDDIKDAMETLIDQLQLGKDREGKKALKAAMRAYVRYLRDPQHALLEMQNFDTIITNLMSTSSAQADTEGGEPA